MFTKPLNVLVYDDILDFTERNQVENESFDYKSEIGNPDKARDGLSKDFSAFANSYGGYIIFGITKNLKIIGIDKKIGNQDVFDWLNRCTSPSVQPPIKYSVSNPIQIPNNDKIILVVFIPESTEKPHMSGDRYYVRIKDESKPAHHFQVRDMFDLNRFRNQEIEEFLSKRNLFDEESEEFCSNINSRRLKCTRILESFSDSPTPLIIFSIFPIRKPYLQRVNLSLNKFRAWLEQKSSGWGPFKGNICHHNFYKAQHKINGIVIPGNDYGDNLWNYFEMLTSGYLESGFSSIFFSGKTGWSNSVVYKFFNSHAAVQYQLTLIYFYKSFAEEMNLNEDFCFQISMQNILGYTIYRKNYVEYPQNTQYKSFKISRVFNPIELKDAEIMALISEMSLMICYAFGFTDDDSFLESGAINPNLENSRGGGGLP